MHLRMPPTIYLSALFLGLLCPVSGPAVARVTTPSATPATSTQTTKPSFDQLAKLADDARTAEHIPDAIRLYRSALRERPSWPDGWWYLATLLYDQDRFDEAGSAFARFAGLAKDPKPAYAFLGLCEYETRDYDNALKHLQKWATAGSPGDEQVRRVADYHLALLLTREGQFAEALYLLTSIAEKRGANPALVEAMGLASLRMNNVPEDYAPEARERVWLAGQAILYSSLRNHQLAYEYAEKLVMHYGGECNVHFLRGTLFSLDKQRSSDAAQEFEQELNISPRHVPAMIALALIYSEQHRAEDAVSIARRATEAEPKSALAHDALGRSLLAAGRLDESATEFFAAKKLAPDVPAIRLRLSDVYQKLGRTKEAAQERDAFDSLTKRAGSAARGTKSSTHPVPKRGRK